MTKEFRNPANLIYF